MEKALAILEKNVQWIALGLCALFLGSMVYSYVLQDPVTVEVKGTPQLPGEIDKAIANLPETQNLKRAVNSAEPLPPALLPKIPSGNEAFAKLLTPVEKIDLGPIKGPIDPRIPPPGTPTYSAFALANAATYVDSMIGRAVVGWQKAPPPAPAAPAGGAAGVPGAVAGGVAAAPPAPPAGVGQAVAQAVVIDVDYSSHLWKAKIDDWTKAMELAGIKRGDLYGVDTKFQLIGVELRRQEKLPTGEWDVAHEVTVAPPAFLDYFQPFNPNEKDPQSYLLWAAANVRNIVQPPFPQPMSGQPWTEPGLPLLAQIQNQSAPGAPPAMPPAVPSPGAPVVPGAAPRTSGEFGEGLAPGGVRLGAPRTGASPTMSPAPTYPGAAPPAPGVAPAAPAVGDAGAVAAQPGVIPGEGAERGMFSPFDELERYATVGAPAEVKFYTHDLTCQGNKTYRYRMRYFVRNPFFKASEKITGPVAEAWFIASPYSDWSKEVTIPPRIEIFASKIHPSQRQDLLPDSVDFDVFLAKDGGWPKVPARNLTPGDPIAGFDTKGEPWNSGWTLVDVRKVPRTGKYYLVIADSNGKMERRDPDTDMQDPKRLQLDNVPNGGVPNLNGQPPLVPPVEGGVRPPVPARPQPGGLPGV